MFSTSFSCGMLIFILGVVADILTIIVFFVSIKEWSTNKKLVVITIVIILSVILYGLYIVEISPVTQPTPTQNLEITPTLSLSSNSETISSKIKCTPNAQAVGIYNMGLAAYNRKDFLSAYSLLKESAEMGNSAAQKLLGDCYRFGLGTKPSEDQAFYWYSKSAEQNDPTGMLYLGYCYHFGIGTEPNYDLALYCYTAAEEGGRYVARSRIDELNEDFGK